MAGHGGKKKRGDDHGDHPDERWLVTYADLMTLLVALFMVLFSISSVNKSKFETLQQTLQEAFSGRILPGGQGIKSNGGTDNIAAPSMQAPETNLQPYTGGRESERDKAKSGAAAAAAEQQQFEQIKKQIDATAKEQGLSGKVTTRVTDDGLLIRVLTDDLLFDSASATPRPQALPLLDKLATVLGSQRDHQLVVSGNTDDRPITSSRFPDNWSLSTSRAESIVRRFMEEGITPTRMTAAGRSSYSPIAPNTTAAGRSLNRRVEIVVPRVAGATSPATSASPSIKPDLAAEAQAATTASASSSSSSSDSAGTAGH